jgi:hypothetical protein
MKIGVHHERLSPDFAQTALLVMDSGLRPLLSGIEGVSQSARQTLPRIRAKNRVAKQRFLEVCRALR